MAHFLNSKSSRKYTADLFQRSGVRRPGWLNLSNILFYDHFKTLYWCLTTIPLQITASCKPFPSVFHRLAANCSHSSDETTYLSQNAVFLPLSTIKIPESCYKLPFLSGVALFNLGSCEALPLHFYRLSRFKTPYDFGASTKPAPSKKLY